jgi:hypothetical protein
VFLKNRREVVVEIDTTEQTEMIVCHGTQKEKNRVLNSYLEVNLQQKSANLYILHRHPSETARMERFSSYLRR